MKDIRHHMKAKALPLFIVASLALAGCATRTSSSECNLPSMEPPNVMLYAKPLLKNHPSVEVILKVNGTTVETLKKSNFSQVRPALVIVGKGSNKSITPSPQPIDIEIDATAPGLTSTKSFKVVSFHNAYSDLRGACTATFWTADVHLSADGSME